MHHRLIADLCATPWAHDRARGLIALQYLLQRETTGHLIINPDDEREKSAAAASDEPTTGIAYHFASGVVMKYRSLLSEPSIDLAKLNAVLKAFANGPHHTLILHLDTPGGSAWGVAQTARLMRQIQSDTGKSIVGYTDTMACSAGQWIFAACSQCYMDAHAYAGSIGVYSVYEDASEFFAKMGIKHTLVSDGKHKAAGHPSFPLTEDQLGKLRRDVELIGTDFRAAITDYRGDVPREAMEGQSLQGEDALAAGLVDGIVDSIDEVIDLCSG